MKISLDLESTGENLFSLTTISHLRLCLKDQNYYAIFIEFKRAFDTVNHNILRQKLYEIGLSPKLIKTFQNLENASMQIKLRGERSDFIELRQRVLQGKILSPYLFALLINDIWLKLKAFGAKYRRT